MYEITLRLKGDNYEKEKVLLVVKEEAKAQRLYALVKELLVPLEKVVGNAKTH